jgi:hypothetical protein
LQVGSREIVAGDGGTDIVDDSGECAGNQE